MKKIRFPFIHHLHHSLKKRAEESQAPYFIFGLFGLINYPTFYIVWKDFMPNEYNNLILRLIATVLCLPLICHTRWPNGLKVYLPLYWYITVLYCLPFFGTFMFLMNHGSSTWFLNGMLVLFLLILIVDWLTFFILLLFGIILGVIIYQLWVGPLPIFSKDTFGAFSTYAWAIIIV